MVRVNRVATISARQAATQPGLLSVGLPARPTNIAGLVAPDCGIHFGLTVFNLFPQPAGRSWNLPVAVPNDSGLIGARLRLQSAYGPTPLSLSNGLQIVIGR